MKIPGYIFLLLFLLLQACSGGVTAEQTGQQPVQADIENTTPLGVKARLVRAISLETTSLHGNYGYE